MFQEENKIPKAMVKYASGISLESIVDILAENKNELDFLNLPLKKKMQLRYGENALNVIDREFADTFGHDDQRQFGLYFIIVDRIPQRGNGE